MNILSGVIPKAQKVVIYGVEGIGKSTFASQFPDPLFIDTEDSTLHMDVKRFDKPTSWTMLLQQIEYVKVNKPCQTLVIDTIDWSEKICKDHLIALNKWTDSSNDYGAKYIALEKEFGGLLNKLSDVVEVGINVVITAHAWLRKKEEPDEMGAYDRYELKLEKKTAPLVKEWADAVLFANYKTTIITDEKTKSKKGLGGQRMMFTNHRPAWDAKNRWGLADELPFDYSQIAQVFANVTPQTQVVENPIRTAANEIAEEKRKANEPIPNFAPERNQDINPSIPVSVADLMKLNQVTNEEILQVIYQGGFMPADTPIENIPDDLWGYLATNWEPAMNLLNTKIRNF
ncbi:ATP-binding protein [uncultured Enterococcus sp.]|uniref:ATP-binding protein n=1 Tax=uncultured Enterococcus sp. TaxID=167972 RepID=UPI002595D75F|nr:ATP-binding protein [uncultured Enterococcus sp.]